MYIYTFIHKADRQTDNHKYILVRVGLKIFKRGREAKMGGLFEKIRDKYTP